MLRMTVRSDLIFTNSQEILAQNLPVLKQMEKLSLKRQERMIIHKVIEMMEAESKGIVKWSYDYQILKALTSAI
jgi:hypothetical protein